MRPFLCALVVLAVPALGLVATAIRPAEAPQDNGEPAPELAVRMYPESEPGQRLDFYGRVFDENGRPLAKAAIIAYNTAADGLYVPRHSADRNPRIRGVAVTDSKGWYRFSTIRPGPYPGANDPAHIHLHVDAAMHQHTYITFWFEGDPLITPQLRSRMDKETVIVRLTRQADGLLTFRHDIRLNGG
jgi:protocatechuate 3,4-dioxygenase beta subunit